MAIEDFSLHLSQSHLLRTASIFMRSNSAELYRVAQWAHPAGCGGGWLQGAPWQEAMNRPGSVTAGSSRLQHQCEHPITRQTSAIQGSLWRSDKFKSSSCDGQEKWWRRCCWRRGRGCCWGMAGDTLMERGDPHQGRDTPEGLQPIGNPRHGRGNKKEGAAEKQKKRIRSKEWQK